MGFFTTWVVQQLRAEMGWQLQDEAYFKQLEKRMSLLTDQVARIQAADDTKWDGAVALIKSLYVAIHNAPVGTDPDVKIALDALEAHVSAHALPTDDTATSPPVTTPDPTPAPADPDPKQDASA